MPRHARIVIPGLAHHVTQRGNNRQDVFFADDDRRLYLELLQQESKRFGLAIMGYCLMTNHVHLIATPSKEDSLAKAIGRTDYLYTQTVNRWHGRSGHLWQNRFYSCALDPGHVGAALRYVELNPVRARTVRKAWSYPWSSAAAHVEGDDDGGLLDLKTWSRVFKMTGAEWQDWLTQKAEPGEVELIRLNTHCGRPLGTDGFLSKIENALGKRLRPLPVGRPKSAQPEDKAKNR